ncbi:MAG: SIMPL domain-containing protein [Symbiobacterium sp.]|uniref:SIMPL domain-containing protein n=1 Tax=Symbiobacterium sp. TaxID=1971213 RepID=UPI0034644FF3
MKPQSFAALVIGLGLLAVLLLLPGHADPGDSPAAAPAVRTITALGQGEVRAKPDQVTLFFTVTAWTEGASAAEAEALIAASVARLREALVNAGADASAVDVHAPEVRPLTAQDAGGKAGPMGYEASAGVAVTLGNLQRADALVDAALAAGATEMAGTEYGLRNSADVRQRALQAAVTDARARAAALAQSQGRTLGDLVSVEVVAEEAPTETSRSSPTALVYRAQVRATFTY